MGSSSKKPSSKKPSSKKGGSSRSKKSSGKKSSSKKSGGSSKHHHHHHHHHKSSRGGSKGKSKSRGSKSHGPSVSAKSRSNKSSNLSKASSSRKDSSKHKFVMKGKAPPSCKDGILSPSRFVADEMTTIYVVPNEHFDCEEDVVKYNGYELGEQIGKGGFATVYKAKNRSTGQMCAAKTVKINNQDAIIEMKNELFIMEMVDNPFAVKLYLHFLVNETLYIFMQLADAGSFGKLLEKGGPMGEKDCQFYFAQMCCGVENMHAKNIAHRDIKPANFLMAEHASGKKIVLISDYGLSRVVHKSGSGSTMLYTTQCGTPAYMAPEILSGEPYNCYLVDVWSLAVTLYAMLNLMTPFNVDQDDYGMQDMIDGLWEWTDDMKDGPPSDGLKSIMNGMLEPDPDARLTIKEACKHKWLADNYNSVKQMTQKSSSGHKK